jgi:hypothetical protein
MILSYAKIRDRNSTKWNNGKTKKGWKLFSLKKLISTGFRGI